MQNISEIYGDKVAFSISKSKEMSKIEVLGILNVISQEVSNQLEDEIKIARG